MAYSSRSCGVTLIELLVVITIMMTVLGLVGGSTLAMVERAKAQTELISVYALVKKASVRAFSSGSRVRMAFVEADLVVQVGGSPPVIKRFKYLDFDAEEMFFNRNGIPSDLFISLRVRGLEKTIDLRSLFDDFQAGEVNEGIDIDN